MLKTKISSKGQVVIPKSVRASLGWKPGMTLALDEKDGRVILAPESTVEPKADFEEVMRMSKKLNYQGPAYTDEEIEAGLLQYFREEWEK